MARNGTGTYNLPVNSWFPAVNGVTATSADWNTTAQDIQAALTQSVSSDGQTPMTGNLAMGGNKITGMANGTAATDAVALGQLNVNNSGDCRLSVAGGNLNLSPYQGNKLTINGILQTVPNAGVGLTPSGLIAGTTYYIYAYMSGATMTLEASTTGHARDVNTGVEIKSGDPTRTLVGMTRVLTGPIFVDNEAQRLCVNWFKRRPLGMRNTNAGAPASGSLTPVAIVNQVEFLAWGDTGVHVYFSGSVSNNTISTVTNSAFGIDSTTAFAHSPSQFQTYAANALGTVSGALAFVPSEGYHSIYLLGSVGGGVATWQAGIQHGGTIFG